MSKTRTRQSNTTEVERLREDFAEKESQFKIQQRRLNAMLSDTSANITEMGILRDFVDKLNQDLSVTKSYLRELGESIGIPERTATDNQTIVSTASVRRKGDEALKDMIQAKLKDTINT